MAHFMTNFQDLGVSGEINKADAPDEVIKITALLKVFSTVIRSLGDDFVLTKSRMFTLDYMVEVSSNPEVIIFTYCTADLRLCCRIGKFPVFSRHGSNVTVMNAKNQKTYMLI